MVNAVKPMTKYYQQIWSNWSPIFMNKKAFYNTKLFLDVSMWCGVFGIWNYIFNCWGSISNKVQWDDSSKGLNSLDHFCIWQYFMFDATALVVVVSKNHTICQNWRPATYHSCIHPGLISIPQPRQNHKYWTTLPDYRGYRAWTWKNYGSYQQAVQPSIQLWQSRANWITSKK